MRKGSRVLIVIVVLAVLVVLGIYLVKSNRPSPTPAPPPESPQVEAPEVPVKVKIYRIAVEGNQAKLRAIEKEVKAGENPMEAALHRLIEQGGEADLANPIPKGTRLLGLEVKDGLATVNLSREFRDNFSGGSEAEVLLIGAVLRTLGQFSEIKRVQLLVEGRPLDTLGHLDLSGPQDVNWMNSGFGDGN